MMPATLEDLAARLTALEDIDAIRQLKARYLRSCDLKQVDQLRDTFLPGPIRVEYQNFPVFTDRDDFLKVYQEMACQEGVYDIHHATNGEITLKGADEAARTRFIDALVHFGIGFSWGGYESLIVPSDPASIRTATGWSDSDPLVRLSIGLEDPTDLIADLERGFAAMAG